MPARPQRTWTLVPALLAGVLSAALPSPGVAPGPFDLRPEKAPAPFRFTLAGDPPAPASHPVAPPLYMIPTPPQSGGQAPAGSTSGPARMKKRWGRAAIEFGLLFSYSAVNYWRKYSMFIEDWQYELTWKDQTRRFFTTEALKLDSNSFYLNWSHGFAGAVYYQFARANHLTWLESWLFATGGSLLWEYCVEWREVISINDNLFTGIGAYASGEAWFQLGRYFSTRPQRLLRVLGFINPFVKLNGWLDRKKPASKAPFNPGWHRFELLAGARRLSAAGREAQDSLYLGLQTQIFAPMEYGRPGAVRRTVHDGISSDLTLDLAKGGGRGEDEAFLRGWTEADLAKGGWADEVNFSARVVSWGLFVQKIDESSRGYSLSFGLGSAFTYFRKTPVLRIDTGELRVRTGEDLQLDKPRYFRDKLAIVHMAGPVLDWTLFRRGLKIRGLAEAYLDFALVNANAFNEYSRIADISGMKTTLLHYGYYYAGGATLSGRLDIDWRSFRLRMLASLQGWDSIEGLDRFQADLTDDRDIHDSRARYLLGAGWRLPRLPLELFARLEGIRRRGRIATASIAGLEKRTFVGLLFYF